MADAQKYTGGCHCGAVRYTVELALEQVFCCNCSICSKTGGLLAFAPAERFTLESGEDQLTDYQFNRHVIHHLFCSRCGIRSFTRGKSPEGAEMVSINACCLDGVDTTTLPVQHYDGRSV